MISTNQDPVTDLFYVTLALGLRATTVAPLLKGFLDLVGKSTGRHSVWLTLYIAKAGINAGQIVST